MNTTLKEISVERLLEQDIPHLVGYNKDILMTDNFSDMSLLRLNHAEDIAGYTIILSEEYLQQLQLDFRFRAQSYISLRDNGPISVPTGELLDLKPYYTLLKKNMEEGNAEVINGLAIALSHTIITLMKRYQARPVPDSERNETRAQQIFDRFMKLLSAYHTKERSLQF